MRKNEDKISKGSLLASSDSLIIKGLYRQSGMPLQHLVADKSISKDLKEVALARAGQTAILHDLPLDLGPILTELGLPLAKTGGILAFFKGPKVAHEVQEAQATIQFLGARLVDVQNYGRVEISQDLEPIPDVTDGAMSLVIIEKISPTPPGFPRSFSLIKQRPPAS